MKAGRFDLGAWLVVAITLGWSAVAAFSSLQALNYPSDGWTISRNSKTGATSLNLYFHPGPTPLRTGDVVLAIGDEQLAVNGRAPVGLGARAGDVLLYTLLRDGQSLRVPVTLAAPGPTALWQALGSRLAQPRDLVVATVAFAVTLFAFLMRPDNLGARYLLLTFCYYFAVQAFGFNVSELYVGAMPPWLRALLSLEGTGWFWFFFPSIMLVALSFPVVKAPLRRFPRLVPALLYGAPAAAALVASAQELGQLDGRWQSLYLPIFVAILAGTVLTLAVTLVHNWLTLREPITRAQLRWVTLGLALGLFAPFGWLLLSLALTGTFPDSDLLLWLPVCVPVSLAIAITRYRLWDIDVIIRRTLVYSVITGLLALAYFGSVLVLESVLRFFTGQGQKSLVVVLSTLAIAALFGPLRARVQRTIDRRFFRSKYDAARTLAGFAMAARDEVDLDHLSTQLVDVVEHAMQPEQVSLWLRPKPRAIVSRPAAYHTEQL